MNLLATFVLLEFSLMGGVFVLTGVIPSERMESQQSICDKHKVSCEPGWSCQAGFILFPAETNIKCDSDESGAKDCQIVNMRVGMGSMEVFCVRNGGELTGLEVTENRRLHDDLRFLSAFRQKRHRRASCVELCNSSQDCALGEVCISNGCDHVCAKEL